MTKVKTYAAALLAVLMLLTQVGLAHHYSVHAVTEQHAAAADKDGDCDLCHLAIDLAQTLGPVIVAFVFAAAVFSPVATTLRRWLPRTATFTYAARAPPSLA